MGKNSKNLINGAFSGKVKGRSPFPTIEGAQRITKRSTTKVWKETV